MSILAELAAEDASTDNIYDSAESGMSDEPRLWPAGRMRFSQLGDVASKQALATLENARYSSCSCHRNISEPKLKIAAQRGGCCVVA